MLLVSPLSPDRLNRVAVIAVELLDPVTLSLVSKDIKVEAEGLTGTPVINLSGRFVWFSEGERWPTRFFINPGHLPFEKDIASAPEKPLTPGEPKPSEDRLVRITLRPTTAYPFTEGVIAVRGQLRWTKNKDSLPVTDADVWIRWLNFPITGNSEEWVNAPLRARTNQFGEFVALLRLPADATPFEKDGNRVKNANLKIRIAVAHGSLICELADPITKWKIYELPEGLPYDLPEALAMSELIPVNNT